MQSTILYQQIDKNLNKNKGLLSFAGRLIQSINSNSSFTLKGMNDKQIFSQIYQQVNLSFGQIGKIIEKEGFSLQNSQSFKDQEQSIQQQNHDKEHQIYQDYEQQKQNQQQSLDIEEEQYQQKEEEKEYQQHQMLEENQEENERDSEQDQQDAYEGEDDIGLYGQELNQQEDQMEDYGNQFDEEQFKQFEKQVGSIGKNKNKKHKKVQQYEQQQVYDEADDNIQDNFDHFRQIQLKNQETKTNQPKNQLQNQIDKLQNKILGQKDWTMKGEVKARERPLNSLLQYDLQFASGVKYSHQITQEKNTQLEQLIKKRVLDQLFDDRSRYVSGEHIREHFGSLKEVSRQKSKMGLSQLYENQFKNFLGLGDNKNDKLKKQIMDSFKQVNYYLDSLSNLNFTPKPILTNANKKQLQAIIVQEKVPLTLWNGQNQKQITKNQKFKFESQKQIDGKSKRMKNKRIARQRKKQQTRKKINKKIQYGGMTKFEAQAQKKSLMNKKPIKINGQNIKYNKSQKFFKNLNQKSEKNSKPNANLSKMKM